eukprot:1656745-Rhodomonas_salina.3
MGIRVLEPAVFVWLPQPRTSETELKSDCVCGNECEDNVLSRPGDPAQNTGALGVEGSLWEQRLGFGGNGGVGSALVVVLLLLVSTNNSSDTADTSTVILLQYEKNCYEVLF